MINQMQILKCYVSYCTHINVLSLYLRICFCYSIGCYRKMCTSGFQDVWFWTQNSYIIYDDIYKQFGEPSFNQIKSGVWCLLKKGWMWYFGTNYLGVFISVFLFWRLFLHLKTSCSENGFFILRSKMFKSTI